MEGRTEVVDEVQGSEVLVNLLRVASVVMVGMNKCKYHRHNLYNHKYNTNFKITTTIISILEKDKWVEEEDVSLVVEVEDGVDLEGVVAGEEEEEDAEMVVAASMRIVLSLANSLMLNECIT